MAGKHTWLAVLEPGHSPPDILKDGVSIFDLSGEEADDVAEFIVRACNSHDELLEALNLMVSNFAGLLNDDDHDRVHAAIAKARGEVA